MTQTIAPTKKAKTTIYMSEEDESMLDEIFIKRLREKNKTDRSALLCEGIRLLYQMEVGNSEPSEKSIP